MQWISSILLCILVVSIVGWLLLIRRSRFSSRNIVSDSSRDTGGGTILGTFWGIIFFGVPILGLVLVASAFYRASEGGCSGQTKWLDGASVLKCSASGDFINSTFPIGRKEKRVIIAKVTFADQAVHFVQVQLQKVTGLIRMDIGVRSNVYKTITIPSQSGVKLSVCVTYDVPRPQPGNWAIRVRDRNGNATYDILQPGQWISYTIDPLTADYRGETQGTLYAYGGPVEEAYLFGSCSR